MPLIRSANPDFRANTGPTIDPVYRHGIDERGAFIPLAFQITSPFSPRLALLPHALVLHVNPQNLSETHGHKVERFQTRGGWVEQHWGNDLSELSADGVTGAFMNVYTGLSSVMRQKTIAWDRFQDLRDLYRNNGSVHDPFGNIVLQGRVMIMYDRGTYLGHFKTFEVEETDDSPFMFKVNWTFKIQETILKIPSVSGTLPNGPAFQSGNHASAIPVSASALAQAQVSTPDEPAMSLFKQQKEAAQQAGTTPKGSNGAATGPVASTPKAISTSAPPRPVANPQVAPPPPAPPPPPPSPAIPPGFEAIGQNPDGSPILKKI